MLRATNTIKTPNISRAYSTMRPDSHTAIVGGGVTCLSDPNWIQCPIVKSEAVTASANC